MNLITKWFDKHLFTHCIIFWRNLEQLIVSEMMLNRFYRCLFAVILEILLQTLSVLLLFYYCMLTTLVAPKLAHIFKNKQKKKRKKEA